MKNWLKHQFTSIRWDWVLKCYWWAYGLYLVGMGVSFYYRGFLIPGESGWITAGGYAIISALWFGLLMLTKKWDREITDGYKKLFELDRELQKGMEEYIAALTENINLKDKKIELLEESLRQRDSDRPAVVINPADLN